MLCRPSYIILAMFGMLNRQLAFAFCLPPYFYYIYAAAEPRSPHMSAKIVYASLFLLNFVDFFPLTCCLNFFFFCLRSALSFLLHICAYPPKVLYAKYKSE